MPKTKQKSSDSADSLHRAGSAYSRNNISGEKYPLPRLMWADCDPDDRKTPVATYDSKADQRGNRPDLKPVRVAVVSLDKNLGEIMTDLYNAVKADRAKRSMPNVQAERPAVNNDTTGK